MALQRTTTSSGLFVNELIFINCTDVQNKISVHHFTLYYVTNFQKYILVFSNIS